MARRFAIRDEIISYSKKLGACLFARFKKKYYLCAANANNNQLKKFQMATKIRLQRFGHKDYAFYQIVIADSRAPRDGKFIERIGSYNPNTNPATINLNFERALYWLTTGAQPTDTVRNILSKEGVLMKKHLLGGVKKGAFTEEVAEQRFEAWLKNKKSAIDAEKAKVSAAKDAAAKKRLEEETEKNKAKAEVVAAKKAAEAAAKAEAEAAAKAEEEANAVAEAPASESAE